MVRYTQLFSVLDEYFLGNSNTNKIFIPGEVDFNTALNCNVTAITAKDNLPVVWIDYPSAK